MWSTTTHAPPREIASAPVTDAATMRLFDSAKSTERHDAGDVIFSRGDIGETFYVVRSGTVRLHVEGATLEEVGPGGVFGEMALIDHEPRSATAVAASECELVPIDERYFRFLVGQTPFFALTVMRAMAGRIRRASAAAKPAAETTATAAAD
jgi:CRP/FNR family transcriptional regulator, cyclic AMP receptor protein